MAEEWNGFSVHLCLLDPVTRKYGGPVWRLHCNTPWWHLGIALRPADRFLDREGRPRWFFTRRW